LANVCDEVFKKLKLFINSPNNVHNVGEDREKWIPNPKANSLSDLSNYYKLGMLLSICFKQMECLELSLPSIFWKYLLTRELIWDDLKWINVNQVVCLEKILSMSDDELDYLEETFTTFLGDGLEYELEVGGKLRKLNAQNRHEYVLKCQQVHLECLKKPFEAMRRGFLDSAFTYAAMDLTPEELEKHCCGMNYVIFNNRRSISPF
jgi:HECT-domain (ubiquitin-transferase)